MNIAKNSVVSIHYTLTDDQGVTVDTSSGGEPLLYLHGHGNIVPGLEKALEGKKAGDKLNVSVPPSEGYGERNDKLIYNVPKTQFPKNETLKLDMQFQVDTENGPAVFTVVEIRENDVVMDGNHPLAGNTLHFAVEVLHLRQATAEELTHGHVHGPGGHHH